MLPKNAKTPAFMFWNASSETYSTLSFQNGDFSDPNFLLICFIQFFFRRKTKDNINELNNRVEF